MYGRETRGAGSKRAVEIPSAGVGREYDDQIVLSILDAKVVGGGMSGFVYEATVAGSTLRPPRTYTPFCRAIP